MEENIDEVTVFQWNVVVSGLECRGLKPWGDVNSDSSRGNSVVNKILTKNPDIVCLQELNRFEMVSEFLKNYGYEGCNLLKGESAKEGIDKDGGAIFWKTPKFVCKDVLKIEKVKNWNQICLCCILDNGKKKIAVASTHLKAYQTESQETVRCNQAIHFTQKYEAWLQQQEKMPDLTLFVGDLNSTPDKKEPWKGSALVSIEQMGYKSSWHVFSSQELKDTNVATFATGKWPKGEVGLYDYVFYKPFDAVSVKYCEGPQPWNSKQSTATANPSDHLPLFVTFQWMK